jgi:hypothetical protein
MADCALQGVFFCADVCRAFGILLLNEWLQPYCERTILSYITIDFALHRQCYLNTKLESDQRRILHLPSFDYTEPNISMFVVTTSPGSIARMTLFLDRNVK